MSDPLFEDTIRINLEMHEGKIRAEFKKVIDGFEKTIEGLKFNLGKSTVTPEGAQKLAKVIGKAIESETKRAINAALRESRKDMLRKMYKEGKISLEEARQAGLGKKFGRTYQEIANEKKQKYDERRHFARLTREENEAARLASYGPREKAKAEARFNAQEENRVRREAARERRRAEAEVEKDRAKRLRDEQRAIKQRVLSEFKANQAVEKERERSVRRQMAIDDRAHRARLRNLEREQRAQQRVGGRVNFSGSARGLRVGAGAAVALGQYRIGGAMYGLANAANMLGDIEIKSVAARTALFGVGAAFAGLGGVALSFAPQLMIMKSALELDKELMNVSTLAYGVVEPLDNVRAGMRQLSEEAVRLSAIYSRDLGDTLEAMRTALSAGVEMPELSNFVGAAGQLAAGLGTDMNKAIDILTTFRDAYGLTAEELQSVNDKLFNVIDVGKVNISELITSLGRVIPVAKTAGASISDVFTAIAGLTRRGFKANVASTSLAKMFEDIIRPPAVARKAAERYGVSDMFGAGGIQRAGGLRGFVESMQSRVGTAGVSEIFRESRGLRSITGLMQVSDLLESLEASINQVGSAAKAAERAQANYLDTMKKITTLISGEFKMMGLDMLTEMFGTPNMDVKDIDNLRMSIKAFGETVRGVVDNFGMVVMPALGSIFGPKGMLVGTILGAVSNIIQMLSDLDGEREKIYNRHERERLAVQSIEDPTLRGGKEFDRLLALPGVRNVGNMYNRDLISGMFGSTPEARARIERLSVGSSTVLRPADIAALREEFIKSTVAEQERQDSIDAWVSTTESLSGRLKASGEEVAKVFSDITQRAQEASEGLKELLEENTKGRFKDRALDWEQRNLSNIENGIKELEFNLDIAREAAAKDALSGWSSQLNEASNLNTSFNQSLKSNVILQAKEDFDNLLAVLDELGDASGAFANELPKEVQSAVGLLSSVPIGEFRTEFGQETRDALTTYFDFVTSFIKSAAINSIDTDSNVKAIQDQLDSLMADALAFRDPIVGREFTRSQRRMRQEVDTFTRPLEDMDGMAAIEYYEARSAEAMRDMEEAIKMDSDDLFNAAKSNYEAYQAVIDEVANSINESVDDFTDAVKDAYEEDAKAYNEAVDEKLKAIKDLQDEITKLDSDFAKSMREMDSRRIGLAEKYLTERQQRRVIGGEVENSRTKFRNALATGDIEGAKYYASQFGDLSSKSIDLSGRTGRRAYNKAMEALDEETRMLTQVFEQERKTMEQQRDNIFREMTNIVTPSVEAAMERIITAWNDKEITAKIENAAVNVNITLPGATIVDQIDPAELANRVTAEIGRIKLAEKRGVDVDPSTSNNRLNRTPSNNKFSTAKQR